MVEVVADVGDLSNVDTIVCDLDGVIYIDGEELDGAGEALVTLSDAGYRIVFVTNNSMKTPRSVVNLVACLTGYQANINDVITSSMVTAEALSGRVDRVYIVGSSQLKAEFDRYGFEVLENHENAEAVVVGLDFDLTYDSLARATLAIRSGALFYATNADASYPTSMGLKPGGGAIVAALEIATGVPPVICGKPHRMMREIVKKRSVSQEILVVGDQPSTDMAMGKAEGWRTCLVLSGVTQDVALVPTHLKPDIVLDSFIDIVPLFFGSDD